MRRPTASSTTWVLAPDVSGVSDRDGVVLFAAQSSSYWRGNLTARIFCEEALAGASVQRVTKVLAEKFGVDETQIAEDLEVLVTELSNASLIVEVPA